ncbi:MAG: sigma-70 family RNA polymerase sigma factor [Mangrovibacterium sp.]
MQNVSRAELERMTDRELIDQVILDNEAVIKYVFFEKCNTLLRYIVREIFSDQLQREELISELYLYLREDNWRKVREFEGRSKFITWISVVAVRFFLKKRASLIVSAGNRTLYTEVVKQIPDKSRDNEMISRIDLINAIQKLKSPREKFVVLTIGIEGRDVDEVAGQLGITRANLYNIKKRALDKLSVILKEDQYAGK